MAALDLSTIEEFKIRYRSYKTSSIGAYRTLQRERVNFNILKNDIQDSPDLTTNQKNQGTALCQNKIDQIDNILNNSLSF